MVKYVYLFLAVVLALCGFVIVEEVCGLNGFLIAVGFWLASCVFSGLSYVRDTNDYEKLLIGDVMNINN